MTQEEKDLLLKDLCERLPYGVKCCVNYTICNETTDYEDVKSSTVDTLIAINQQTKSCFFEWLCEWFNIDEFKPYLFPLSSMTEEQKIEYSTLCYEEERECYECGEWVTRVYLHNTIESIDWLNKNHFDYRCLIEKDLALNASELNVY